MPDESNQENQEGELVVRSAYEGEIPPDLRAQTLARIVAAHAADWPELQNFRREVLGGKLLTREEIARWVQATSKREGSTTFVTSPDPGWREPRRTREMYFPVPDHPRPQFVPLKAGGILWRLYELVGDLGLYLGFEEAPDVSPRDEARLVELVLTGEIRLPLGRATLSGPKHPATLETITLELSPRLTRKQVVDLYVEARKKMGVSGRDLREPWRAELAVFADSLSKGTTWREAMEEWNRTRGHLHHFDDWRTFAADCHDSYSRITGSDLSWRFEDRTGRWGEERGS